MKCPKCGHENVKYVQRRDSFTKTGAGSDKKTFKRTDFRIDCPTCGIFDEREPLKDLSNPGA
jgi:ribosomal protein S27E